MKHIKIRKQIEKLWTAMNNDNTWSWSNSHFKVKKRLRACLEFMEREKINEREITEKVGFSFMLFDFCEEK